jgi:hypothetical protein
MSSSIFTYLRILLVSTKDDNLVEKTLSEIDNYLEDFFLKFVDHDSIHWKNELSFRKFSSLDRFDLFNFFLRSLIRFKFYSNELSSIFKIV